MLVNFISYTLGAIQNWMRCGSVSIRWTSAPRPAFLFFIGLLFYGTTLAKPIDPVTLHQPAQAANWAAKALMLSVARAGSNLVAVGEHGFILLSKDNGHTWQQAASVPTTVTLTKVRFATPTEGWVVGHMGAVLHTVDGGNTWTMVTDGIRSAELAVQYAKQLSTLPGKSQKDAEVQINNAALLVADGPDKPLLALLIPNAHQILAFGAFGTGLRIDKTNMRAVPLFDEVENPDGLHIYGLAQYAETMYAVGERGLFLRSRKGGPFESLPTSYKGTFFGVLTDRTGIVLAYGLRGTLLRSEDQGVNWRLVSSGTQLSITSGTVMADGRILLGVQSGQILISSDAGRTFKTCVVAPQPVAELAQAADGSVIVVGPRGVTRIDSPCKVEP